MVVAASYPHNLHTAALLFDKLKKGIWTLKFYVVQTLEFQHI